MDLDGYTDFVFLRLGCNFVCIGEICHSDIVSRGDTGVHGGHVVEQKLDDVYPGLTNH